MAPEGTERVTPDAGEALTGYARLSGAESRLDPLWESSMARDCTRTLVRLAEGWRPGFGSPEADCLNTGGRGKLSTSARGRQVGLPITRAELFEISVVALPALTTNLAATS